MKLELQQISKNSKISNFMNICAVGAEFFHADRRTDMKLVVTFRNFVNTPENLFYCRNIQRIVITIDGVSVAF